MLTMTIKNLLKDLVSYQGDDLEITGISCDSRKIKAGNLFVAISGENLSGHDYAVKAQENGAIAVLSNQAIKVNSNTNSIISDLDIRELYTLLVNRFYSNPTSKLQSIAVTGTNGKTSTAWIASRILHYLGQKNLLAGTLGLGLSTDDIDLDKFIQTNNTTPIAEDLYQCINKFSEISSLSMEVTSQGLAQNRTTGFNWDVAIFTNLTRDHLDLHGSLENYAELKSSLFKAELAKSKKKRKIAIINTDDDYGNKLFQELQNLEIESVSVSMNAESQSDIVLDVLCFNEKISIEGIEFSLKIESKRHDFKSKLVGSFNLWNLTFAILAVHSLGYDLEEIKLVLPKVENVPGRLEYFEKDGVLVFVDYAHTPDALDSVQKSLLELKPANLITVFGCGGDRDSGKRALMAKSVQKYSNKAIVSSDNPRTEDPNSIIDMIVKGFDDSYQYIREPDRKEAIKKAIEISKPRDIVLIAGKGHETYQEINGIKNDFDDREVVKALL